MAENDAGAQSLATGLPENSKAAEGGNQVQSSSDWKNGFDSDLKTRVERFKEPADLAKSYIELEKFTSKSVQDMTPEEKAKLYKRLGRPEKQDEYELSTMALPKGLDRGENGDKAFREMALANNLTKEQAKSIHEWATKQAVDGYVGMQQSRAKQAEEASSTLRKEWGLDFEPNLRGVNSLIQNYGDADLVQLMNSGPGNAPAMLRFLKRIRDTMTDDTLESGRVPPPKTESGGKPGYVVDFASKSPELVSTRTR
jgi:hypothetical protein